MLPESLQHESSTTITKDERGEAVRHKEARARAGGFDADSQLEQAFISSPAKQEFVARHPQAVETRTLLKVSPQSLPNHLTAHTLAGPCKISVPPYVLIDNEFGCLLAYYHLGTDLSGHRGLVHGGFLAVLLDECMGRACFPLLPEKIGVTVHIELDYKNPVKGDSLIVIRAETERVEGRKAWVKGVVEAVGENDGQVLVESKAIFVQPRWAAGMELLM
jgi:hypothetical protein